MMKKYLLLILCLSFYLMGIAQTHVVTIEYQKADQEALENEMAYSQNAVFSAIDENMSKLGYKGKNEKDFVVYRGAVLPELGGGAYDLYFSVDKKNKKDKENSMVRMMISKGGKIFITSSTDAEIMGKARTYLDSLPHLVAVYDYDQQVLAQADFVKKNEKKLNNLLDDAIDLEKRRRRIDELITENNKAQVSQQQELENQRKTLETMKSNRKE